MYASWVDCACWTLHALYSVCVLISAYTKTYRAPQPSWHAMQGTCVMHKHDLLGVEQLLGNEQGPYDVICHTPCTRRHN